MGHRPAGRAAAGHVLALLVALAIAAFNFGYRFNALGGALGGFDDDDFAHLMRTEMVVRGEQPLRDFAEFDLRGAWPSLTYEIPALAQRIWGRTLLSQAYLMVGALAACAGAIFLLARALAGRWTPALLAGAAAIVCGIELYNYPKMLVLTGAVAALMFAMRAPSFFALVVLAAWTAVGILFRHDYGVYIGAAALAGLVAREPRPWRLPARRIAAYAALTTAFMLPSIVWVQRYEGIKRYVSNTLGASRAETATRTLHGWPAIDPAAPLGEASLTAVIYYAFWMVPAAAALVLVARPWRNAGERSARVRGVGFALLTLAVGVNLMFLRSNLLSRFGDAVGPAALLAAWTAGAASYFGGRVPRVLAAAAPAILLSVMIAAMWRANTLAQELRTAGLTVSAQRTLDRFQYVRATLRRQPPVTWTDRDAEGTLAAARYLAECTGRDDYILMGTYAGEVPVYARRRFAGGQGIFALGFYTSESDQRRVVERLRGQSVPVVITGDDFEGEFAEDYPLVAAYVRQRYRDAGTISVEGRPRFRVFVEADRPPTGTHPILGLPCFQ